MPELREELGRAELEAAQRGFECLLRRKRFSRAFLDRHAADLLAKARLEYSQHVADGGDVRNPAGWIIHCAWRRTQNLLEQEGRTPRVLSIDGGGAFANESATPEEEVLSADRYLQLHTALEQLPREERKVIALTYFEGMSVREAGRALKWDKCKADRRHRAALERLQELLGVKDIDSLQIEIGIVAWASLGAAAGTRTRLPAGVETMLDGITSVAARGQDLARRLLTGGAAEPGIAPAVSGAARTAGVCGAAAVACVATGLVGPGVGGVDVLADQHQRKPAAERPAPSTTIEETASEIEIAPPAPPPTESSASAAGSGAKRNASKSKTPRRRTRSPGAAASATPQQVAEEFDPFTGGSTGSSSGSGASSSSTSSSSTGSSTSPPPPPPASGKQVESEFGL
ncbi:MAG: sigma-70 family RNA polymerase sigma factor [Solirubrobacterales bacterium]